MPLVDIAAARREVRLAAVLGLLRWRPRERRGEQVRGGCPLHGPAAPNGRSFSAHLGRGAWRCFRCGAQGNALDPWALATGQELYPAVLDLYDRLGRPVPWLRRAGAGRGAPVTTTRGKEDAIDHKRA